MSVKSEISANYLSEQKVIHAQKQPRVPPCVMITGDSKAGSIGEAIRKHLSSSCQVDSFQGDICNDTTGIILDDYDTLIMCHGCTHLDWFESYPLSKAKRIFDVNLFGSFKMTQAFVKETINTEHRKRIISIGSMAYKAVLNGSAAYCASKAGLAHLMKCLAWELAPKGYDVYSIHPSNTLGTPMSKDTIEGLQHYRKMTEQQATDYWNDTMIRQQSLTTDEIVELIYYLLFHKTGYLSGAQLELGGGQR